MSGGATVHAHPQLPNRETRTAQLVAERLRHLHMNKVRTGIRSHRCHRGSPGRQTEPVVALGAGMDALPIVEEAGLPFASKTDPAQAAEVHSAKFLLDEAALPIGVQAMGSLATEFLLHN